jgi:hemerythrin
MKLRFAFDKIRSAEELLHFRVVDREVITLAEGLRLRRTGSNQYLFIHEGQTLSVDMNQGGRSGYRPPYHLDHHRAEREYFSVIHTGEGDGWDPDHPCMSSIVTFQASRLGPQWP